jgi:hypothetical protein
VRQDSDSHVDEGAGIALQEGKAKIVLYGERPMMAVQAEWTKIALQEKGAGIALQEGG